MNRNAPGQPSIRNHTVRATRIMPVAIDETQRAGGGGRCWPQIRIADISGRDQLTQHRLQLIKANDHTRHSNGPPPPQLDSRCELDKSWDAIHRCLTDGTLKPGQPPLSLAILGGQRLDDGRDFIMSLALGHSPFRDRPCIECPPGNGECPRFGTSGA